MSVKQLLNAHNLNTFMFGDSLRSSRFRFHILDRSAANDSEYDFMKVVQQTIKDYDEQFGCDFLLHFPGYNKPEVLSLTTVEDVRRRIVVIEQENISAMHEVQRLKDTIERLIKSPLIAEHKAIALQKGLESLLEQLK